MRMQNNVLPLHKDNEQLKLDLVKAGYPRYNLHTYKHAKSEKSKTELVNNLKIAMKILSTTYTSFIWFNNPNP